jgi:hypothetical protein
MFKFNLAIAVLALPILVQASPHDYRCHINDLYDDKIFAADGETLKHAEYNLFQACLDQGMTKGYCHLILKQKDDTKVCYPLVSEGQR